MEFRIRIALMRARTMFVLFLAAIVAGGLAVFSLALVSDLSFAAKTIKPGAKPAAGAAKSEEAVRWREMDPALAEAKSSGKTILVDVYTDWCGWCKRMDRDTYAKPEVKKYLDKNFVTVRLNAEANTKVHYQEHDYTYRELASGFRVTGYPTTLFLGPDGKHLASAPGYMKADDFMSVLHYFGDGHYKKKSFQEYQDELGAQEEPAADGTP